MQATAKFVAVCWVVVIGFWIISAFSVKRTKERQPLSGRLLYLWLAIVAGALLTGGISAMHLNRAVLLHTLGTGILADCLVSAGLCIAVWARAVLGRNWSARVTWKENHELIQGGPYRVVRHPIYSGLLVMIPFVET